MLVICTGGSGLVGWNFLQSASKRGIRVIALYDKTEIPSLVGIESIKMDLTDLGQVERLVIDKFPDAIVNCAAISSPVDVDKNPELAERLNVSLPDKLSMLANHLNARFLHLSTDMVFDGHSAPYKNTDIPNPLNLYGEMKLLAEKKILKNAAQFSVVLRISHVCGNSLSGKRSLHEKLLRSFVDGEKVLLNRNEVKKFLSASRIGDLLVELLERTNISGIHHYCGMEALSRYEMGKMVCEKFRLNPSEFLEESSLVSDVDLSLDMSDLVKFIKTPSPSLSEILDEMSIPKFAEEWIREKSGITQIKRYKLT